jgi:DNA gyrase subunit A
MAEFAAETIQISLEAELKQSYLDYAMSVIVGRALPDVRDGLKPVHRRVLFAMEVLNNDWNKPYKKSARVVGDVIGKYHPHGDTAVYDTIVRMAQPFSMRKVLVDGQGNFGSVDGDNAAAMRYTEIRMTKLAHALLEDLDKETVDFAPNYDGTEFAPTVLPARVPNLLVNGSSGIAVGMATNIPPHNLGEIVDACIALIATPDLTIDQLLEIIPGPDFPTSGIINGKAGIVEAYRTGRGRIYIRAKADIETNEKNGKQSIIVHELPYQVNKAKLLEKIAELVKTKRIEGITALRDESDKDGMRMVVELRRGEVAEVILNNLYSQTVMESVFGINMVALDNGQPRLLNLKQILDAFIQHRREVVTRRTIYELRKARERAHVLEGLGIALANIDPVIEMIKKSSNPAEAKEKLLLKAWAPGVVADMLQRAGSDVCRPDDLAEQYGFSEGVYTLSPAQAQAILDLKLHRLTGLEQEKILTEYKSVIIAIEELLSILESHVKLMKVIKEELEEIKQQFADERRTEIISSKRDLSIEDLITEEDVVVTLSHQGYVKTQPVTDYQAQRRGGKGKSATKVKDEDFVEELIIANTHDTILCFSTKGKVYWLKTYQLPQGSRTSRGKPIVNVLPIDADEKISAILPIKEFTEDQFVFMATTNGTVKKVSLTHFSRPRANGIIAIDLPEENQLVGAVLTNGEQDIMLYSDAGKVVRFQESNVRAMGRTARGVRGISLKEGQTLIALNVVRENAKVLTATEHGYGKRTEQDEYRTSSRGGSGVISIQVTERNGPVVGAIQVRDEDELMLISDKGTMVRLRAAEVSTIGRNTQGVRLIRLGEGEKLIGLQRIADLDDAEVADETDTDVDVDAVVETDAIIEADTADDIEEK